ncbi:MAG: DUF4258 domain-containing protein [Gammaproteobacteria bacterium]|nr:DUF4258 domain-containing protein [Gammaproteobacteria bacterium]
MQEAPLPARNITELNLTPESARRVISDIAKTSGRVFFTDHAEERMQERQITRAQVLRCLRSGRIIEGPAKGQNDDWTFLMEVISAGDIIKTAAALGFDSDGNRIVVITVY